MMQEDWIKEKERYEEEGNFKNKSDINQIKDMIKVIDKEMDSLHAKIKLLENEFQESKEKIREKEAIFSPFPAPKPAQTQLSSARASRSGPS